MPSSNGVSLAVDAGGTFMKYAVADAQGELLTPVRQQPSRPDGTIEQIMEVYRSMVVQAESEGYRLSAMGISTPGPFDYDRGTSLMTHKYRELLGVDLREAIPRACGRELPVRFVSDSNAFLLGEHDAGAGRGCGNLMGVTIGTGLGLSIMRDGRLLTDERGGPREKIYHLPNGDATLEETVSGRGIVRLYEQLSRGAGSNGNGRRRYGEKAGSESDTGQVDLPPLTAKDVYERAVLGEAAASAAFREAGLALGRAVRELTAAYRSERIVIGGQVARAFDWLEAGIVDGMRRRADGPCSGDVQVVRAQDLEGAALRGIAWLMRG